MAKYKITKQEWKLIGGFSVIILILFSLFKFTKLFDWITTLNPVLQFLIVCLGIYGALFALINIITSRKIANGISLVALLTVLIVDVIKPDYHVTINGLLVKGGELGTATFDYSLGYIWQSVGVSGVWLWICTYFISTLILLLVASYFGADLVKKIKG